MDKYLDHTFTAAERAQDLLSKMSLEEKMAQTACVLVLIGREQEAAGYCRYGIGEVSTLEVRNLKTAEEAAGFQKKIQSMVMENSPHHIPAIFHMEGLCGALIQDAVSFPSGIGRASSWDTQLEERIAHIVARQENAAGITHTLAPVKLLNGKWRTYVIYELCKKPSCRFGELKKAIPKVTNTMLTSTLRDLEQLGIVNRVQYNEIPPHVEYSLTQKGKELLPVFMEIAKWGENNLGDSEI